MSYTLYTNLRAKSISYGKTRSASSIKYLVYHYTGNTTDSARGNANYFATSNTRSAGAHYFVDDSSVYHSIDDLRVAWSVGGSKYSNCGRTGGGTLHGICTNSNSISIEMCSKNGAITEATQENAIALGKTLMKKYGIDINHVCRHFDVTGKSCPGWSGWTGTNAPKWSEFKAKLNGGAAPAPAASPQPQSTNTSYSVIVTAQSGLNCRQGPGTNYAKVKAYAKGTRLNISKESSGWGYTGEGWVSLQHTSKSSGSAQSSVTYYPKYVGSSSSISDALRSIGVDGSLSNRKKIAAINGISGYSGSASQNTKMLGLLKQGKLKKSGSSSTSAPSSSSYYRRYTGSSGSLVDALSSIGVNSSLSNRKKIATANGIRGYNGSASQNTKMLNLLKQGKLKKC